MTDHPLGTALAKECFAEAINKQGGPLALCKTDPVQFNLLQGLLNLATAIEQLQKDVQELKNRP